MTLSVMTLGLLIWRLYDRDPFFWIDIYLSPGDP